MAVVVGSQSFTWTSGPNSEWLNLNQGLVLESMWMPLDDDTTTSGPPGSLVRAQNLAWVAPLTLRTKL